MTMPQKLQPGPLAGEMSYAAPVSLFFFFFLMFIITTLRNIDLHPMNYFFLATAFFAFHLLLAYSGGPYFDPRGHDSGVSDFGCPGGLLFAVGGRTAVRCVESWHSTIDLPGAVLLCVFLEGIYGPGNHSNRDHYSVCRDAGHRKDSLVRAICALARAADQRGLSCDRGGRLWPPGSLTRIPRIRLQSSRHVAHRALRRSQQRFVHDAVLASCRRHPQKTALVDTSCGRRLTYAEYGETVEALARGLVAAGVKSGEVIGIFLANSWESARLTMRRPSREEFRPCFNPLIASGKCGISWEIRAR